MSLGGPGTTTPNYVRSATFKNTAEGEVTLKVSFQSGHSEDYTIAAGASRTVERDVENGSHTEVDPITGFTATEGGKTANGDWAAANGVENRSYNIAAGGIATQAWWYILVTSLFIIFLHWGCTLLVLRVGFVSSKDTILKLTNQPLEY